MKLELKNIAPYLPYELKFQVPKYYNFGGTKTDMEIMEMQSLKGTWIMFYEANSFHPLNKFKPILRPLSDLIKPEFELDEWRKKAILFLDETANLPFNSRLEHVGSIMYSDVLFLLENHFDIFGLIKKELAIDINTLKK